MSYLEELLPEFRKGAKIRNKKWEKENYVIYRDEFIYDNTGAKYNLFSAMGLVDKDWEFYKEPEFDWDYIIKNNCLCWFWDDNTEEPNFADRLISVRENSSGVKYITKGKVSFEYCRPVRREEVTFYEDRKDD